MDKFETLQSDFHQQLNELVKCKDLNESDAIIVRQTFSLCAKRILRIEISNMIEFAKSEGLL
jgi:hypothetical protein